MTPHLNRLTETVQMLGHNISFYAELTNSIPNYHQILPFSRVLICSAIFQRQTPSVLCVHLPGEQISIVLLLNEKICSFKRNLSFISRLNEEERQNENGRVYSPKSTVMCLKIGTPKHNKFFIYSKWKINYF